MMKHIATVSVLALTFVSCKTTSGQSSESDITAAKGRGGKEMRFVCKNEADKTSKSFRPKQMTDNIEVTIVVTSDWKSVAMEIGPKGSTPEKSILASISGDEGYNEFTVAKDVVKKYGFEYVNINYDDEDEYQTPTHADLIHGGSFSTCVLKKK